MVKKRVYKADFDLHQPNIEAKFELEPQKFDTIFEVGINARKLDELKDVEINNLREGQALVFSAPLQKWVNTTQKQGSSEWGEITGDIENQEDLQEELDKKLDKNNPIKAGTHSKITYDKNGLIINGEDLPLEELENVKINNPTTGQNLTYDAVNKVWKNTSTSATVAWGGITGDIQDQADLQEEFSTKQNELISGENIKTINNQTILGSGNLEIASSTFMFEQGVASDTWTITHNLDRFPSVSVIDSAESVIECSVNYVDTNNCILYFNGEFKGKAYLN